MTPAAERAPAAARVATVSPDGRVAVVSLLYPELQRLDAADLDELKETVAELRSGSTLQIEAGGDLFFAFEEPETGGGELAGSWSPPSCCCWPSARSWRPGCRSESR